MKASKSEPDETRKGIGGAVSGSEAARLRAALRDFNKVLTRVRDAVNAPGGAGDPASAADTLARVERMAEKYRMAIQLRLRGLSIDKIEAILNIRSASRWVKGRVPRMLLNLDPQFRRQFEKPIDLPRRPSAELAFILGVFCGRSGVTKKYRGFEIHSRDPAMVEKLAVDFKRIFAATGTTKIEQYGGTRYHHFRIGANQLGRYFEQATQKNRTVPLRELPDSNCRRAFLKGFFSSCASAIRPERRKVHVVKSHNRSMLDGVAIVLKREGVLATVYGQDRAELLIQDQNDLDRFRELGVLSSAADVAALEAICASRPKRRMFTVQEYRTAIAIAQANTALSVGELSDLIAKQTNGRVIIDKSILRQWRGTTRPDCMRRLENLVPIESAMRATAVAIEIHRKHLRRARMLREPSQLLPILREIAWLQGEEEWDFPLKVSTLEKYRALFERLNLPFTPAHEKGWHQRSEIREHAASIGRIVNQISVAHCPTATLALLRELAELTGNDPRSITVVVPNLATYREMFCQQNIDFRDAHECGWHEAINASDQVQQLPPVARGVHNLIRRDWESSDAWIKQMSSPQADRCWRTFDGLMEGRHVLQRDLIELLSALGVERATPAMAWLVGLSIAPEPEVLSQLTSVMPKLRDELSGLFQSQNWTTTASDPAKVQLYRLLPGLNLCSLRQNAAAISKCLAQPFTSHTPVQVNEDLMLRWLDHVPKYRARLGMLTEVARKAQQSGLDPKWAVAMVIDRQPK